MISHLESDLVTSGLSNLEAMFRAIKDLVEPTSTANSLARIGMDMVIDLSNDIDLHSDPNGRHQLS